MNNKSKSISAGKLKSMSSDFSGKRANMIASNAAFKNGLAAAAEDYKAASKMPFTFSIDLDQGKTTNQKASGRCWIFSALNTFRYEIIHKYNLDNFELSQNYIFFYDKLEKSNYFLESVIATADEPVDGRLYSFINMAPLGDGGQWDMLANLVNKYGVVPKDAYPDSANAANSRMLCEYISSKLREDAVVLRKAIAKGNSEAKVRQLKEDMMTDVYRMLAISLGEPPKKFDLTLTDKDKKVICEYGITPKKFYEKYVGLDLTDRVSLINAPASNKPMNKMYTVKFLGNVIEGSPVSYLNVDIDIIKQAMIEQLKDGHPVWFGSDVSKFGLRDSGIWDRKSSGIEQFFNVSFDFSKGDRLIYGDSAMNHAMVILGVNLDSKGRPNRWHIENSWGEKAGHNGHYLCSDAWFDEFVYQAVVDKKYLPEDVVALLDQKAIELEPWDPMGSLAD